MTRWQAAGRHLAISAMVAVPILVLMSWVWYPPPLFLAAGAAKLALTIIGVDVVVGPLLTLIVYKQGKRGMRFDLWVIGLLQAAALAFGLSVSVDSRPAYIVATPGAAVLVHARELYYGPTADRDTLPRPPMWGPEVVAALPARDAAEKQQLVQDVMAGRPDVEFRPDRYREVGELFDGLAASATPLATLATRDAQTAGAVADWRASHGYPPDAPLLALPLITRNRELALVLDPASRRAVGMLDVVVE